MSKADPLCAIISWVQKHAGVFIFEEEGKKLLLTECFSGKRLMLEKSKIEAMEEKQHPLSPQSSYLVLMFEQGRQVVLCAQGFAFPPDFSNTGHLALPNQVYCMRDFHHLRGVLEHLAASEERRGEALSLLMVMIAILDGAKAAGLNVDLETLQTEKILSQLERGLSPTFT